MGNGSYVAAAYAIALGLTVLLSAGALVRLRLAKRRLRIVDAGRGRR